MQKDLFYQSTPASEAGRHLLALALRPGVVAKAHKVS